MSNDNSCEEIKTNSVILKCEVEKDPNKLLETELCVRFNEYDSKLWGVPWLYTQFFRKFDVVVVYTKKGVKRTINSAQRMANSIHSGVITVIERTGVHALYVSESYPCSFTNQVELRKVLNNLDKNISMRKECQRQAKLINNAFKPETIMRKYHDLLTSDL